MNGDVIKFSGHYYTTDRGFTKLNKFYEEASQFSQRTISLDFYDLKWFDGNLTAILAAMMYKLSKENRLSFSTDIAYISDKFDLLIKNQFILGPDFGDLKNKDFNTLPLRSFKPNDKDGFIGYLDNHLFPHRGMPPTSSEEIYKRVKADLIEIFCNIHEHAKTKYPCFLCGQFYEDKKYLALTITDLGIGFLPPIQKKTSNEIKTHSSAILWALDGNTVKRNKTPGGLGISSIRKYCAENNGIFHIISGNAYWGSDIEKSILRGVAELDYSFCGSTINLFFNWK